MPANPWKPELQKQQPVSLLTGEYCLNFVVMAPHLIANINNIQTLQYCWHTVILIISYKIFLKQSFTSHTTRRLFNSTHLTVHLVNFSIYVPVFLYFRILQLLTFQFETTQCIVIGFTLLFLRSLTPAAFDARVDIKS